MIKSKDIDIINVSVSNRSKYITTYFIRGVKFTMRCGYNTRNKMRWVIILDDAGRVLLPQTFLKSGKRCELNFVANQYDLDFYITLRAKDVRKVFSDSYDYLNWSRDFDICFVGTSQTLRDECNVSIRKYLVGN